MPSSTIRAPSAGKPTPSRVRTSSWTPSTPITGVGRIGGAAGLVVEADVAAGHRDAERLAAVGQAADGLGQLPHDLRVLRGPEVQAVGHRDRARPGHGDVPVRLGQRQLGALVRVEQAVAAVAVGGERDAEAGLLVDPEQAAVLGHRQHGVAAHDVRRTAGSPSACRPGRASRAAPAGSRDAPRRRPGGPAPPGRPRPARRGPPGGSSGARRPGRRPRSSAGSRRPWRRARSWSAVRPRSPRR